MDTGFRRWMFISEVNRGSVVLQFWPTILFNTRLSRSFNFNFHPLLCFAEDTLPPATRGLLATDHVIWNHGQVTWTTSELAPPSPT
ncbi:UNVERIFIED_CONTAM: hypothetical protein NCL1_56314 [Trichonephila clavipes]